jgi:hypothetical protein
MSGLLDEEYDARLAGRDPYATPASRLGVAGVAVPRQGRERMSFGDMARGVGQGVQALGSLVPTPGAMLRGYSSALAGMDIPEGSRVIQTDMTDSGYAFLLADGRMVDPAGRQGRDVREWAATERRGSVLPLSQNTDTGEVSLAVPGLLDALPMAGMQGGPAGALGAGAGRRARLNAGGPSTIPTYDDFVRRGVITPEPTAPVGGAAASTSGDIVNQGAAAGLGGGVRGMAAVPNLRVLSAADAARVAANEPHLIRTADSGYVGAPDWVRAPEDLAKLRADLDELIDAGGPYRGWYQRTRDFIREVSGGDPYRERHISQGLGVTSPQASPDTNLNFQAQAITAYERGQPAEIVRTGNTARAYNEGRAAIEADAANVARQAGGQPSIGDNRPPIGERIVDEEPPQMRLGRKTGVYAQQIDPSAPWAPTGTNDTWMARAFGFRNPSGDAGPFAGSVTPQMHAFMDYETVLAVQRANARRAGGFNDWNAANIQEVPWVVLGGRMNSERLGIPFEEAVQRMDRTYPDYAGNYSAYLPHEQVPGRSTGVLPGLLDPEQGDAREAFSRAATWRTRTGNDALLQDIGLMNRYTQEAPGIYRNSEGVLERNPTEVATAIVPNVELPHSGRGAAPRGVDPRAGETLTGVQAVRGLVDAQEGSPWYYIQAPDPQGVGRGGGAQNNFRVDLGRQPTRAEADALQAIAEREGFSFSNSRDGAAFLNFGDMDNAQAGRAMKRLQTEISAINPRARVSRGRRDGDYVDLSEELSVENQGQGRATQKALSYVDAMPGAAGERLLDSPAIRQKAEQNLRRLVEYGGQGQRPDYERMLNILSVGGLRGLRDFVRRNGPAGLPATLLTALGLQEATGEPAPSRGLLAE